MTINPEHLSELVPDPDNFRKHNPKNIGVIVDALHEVGAARSIVIDENNVILAGNGVVEAAAEAGIERVRVIEASGDEIIAVRRVGLTPQEKQRLALYDNRAGELAEWDTAKLAAAFAAAPDLAGKMWTAAEAAAFIAEARAQSGEETPEPPTPGFRDTTIQRGDIFGLGQHRVMCGDSTVAGDVAQLLMGERPDAIITDPPYGMNLDTDYTWMQSKMSGSGGRRYPPVAGDDKPFDAKRVRDIVSAPEEFWFGADYYIRTLPEGGSWLVWDKREDESADNGFGSAFELIWSKVKHKRTFIRHRWFGFLADGADADDRLHPTQKPIGVIARILTEWASGHAIYDPFAGSGSTLIACEREQRSCYAMELEPAYVQVIVDRWEAETKQSAVKVPAAGSPATG